jgi:hypothetical protein
VAAKGKVLEFAAPRAVNTTEADAHIRDTRQAVAALVPGLDLLPPLKAILVEVGNWEARHDTDDVGIVIR